MSKASFPFDWSDKTIELLLSKTVKRVSATKSKLSVLKFDELNVMKKLTDLYKELDKDNRIAFLDLARGVYGRAQPHGNKKPDEDWLLEFIFSMPCPVTKYVYDNEIVRKRDKAIEAVNSVTGNNNKLAEIDHHARYWETQTEFYSDYTADMATRKAYKDAGVKEVRWETAKDGKVCKDCKALDGRVFPIGNIPERPHPRCRCRLIPLSTD